MRCRVAYVARFGMDGTAFSRSCRQSQSAPETDRPSAASAIYDAFSSTVLDRRFARSR